MHKTSKEILPVILKWPMVCEALRQALVKPFQHTCKIGIIEEVCR